MKVGMAPKRSKGTTTTSPYFQTPTGIKRQSTSSPYFLQSPSSVFGAIQSLGPLVHTWHNHDAMMSSSRCTRQENEACCSACKDGVLEVLSQFSHCPDFQKNNLHHYSETFLERANDNGGLFLKQEQHGCSSSISCLELVGILIEEQVRHLCHHGCYLRAFAPRREWLALRSTIQRHTDQPIETLLQTWTCKLQQPPTKLVDPSYSKESLSGQSAGGKTLTERRAREECKGETEEGFTIHRPKNSSSPHLPRILFWNRYNDKKYINIPQIVRAMGLDSDSESNSEETSLDVVASCSSNVVPRKRQRIVTPPKTLRTKTINYYAHPDAMSPLGLLEELFANNPWQLLLSTILLNRTRRIQVDTVMYEFLKAWPTPQAVIAADMDQLKKVIAPLGFHQRRAAGIVQFCKDFLALTANKEKEDKEREECIRPGASLTTRISYPPKVGRLEEERQPVAFSLTRLEITSLYHCGTYVADAYQIFIRRDWTSVEPRDDALRAYVEWKRGEQQQQNWTTKHTATKPNLAPPSCFPSSLPCQCFESADKSGK